MARLKPTHRTQLRFKAPSSDGLALFQVAYRQSIKKSSSPLYRKEKSSRSWILMFLLVASILVALASLSQAAPPRSRGARPIALGNGYSAVAGDAYSLFYNPAGLHKIRQKEVIADFGRSYSENESARTGFNGLYAKPWKWRENYAPLAFGFYGEQPAKGAHIIDFTAGSAMIVPMERWTRGLYKLETVGGLALTIRHQNGELRSPRVGGSALALGLSGGFYSSINRRHKIGMAIRHLFAGDGDPRGPSINFGVLRKHRPYLTVLADLQYARGGVFRFQPGAEWNFLRGVLRPRLGWGFRDNGGVDSVATGVGFYLSPYQIDISYLIPVKSLADNAGQFRASLRYRFGDPQFTQIYYDRALEAASELDENVTDLTVKEAELKSSLIELEQKLHLAREELKGSRDRIGKLKEQDLLGQRDEEIRKLKARVKKLEGTLSSQRSRNKALRRKKATIKMHSVRPGDTLQSLAEKYYGDSSQWKKIFNANVDKIDRGLPRVGAKLVIP